jgi:hypothetical protein
LVEVRAAGLITCECGKRWFGGRQGERDSEAGEVGEVGELYIIDNVYLQGIESLYTWKTLVPESLRSGLYYDKLMHSKLTVS